MPLQLSIENTTGDVYEESYHVITEVHTKGLLGTCMFVIQVWANQAAFLAGKTAISYDGWGRDFYTIICTPSEYLGMANDPVTEDDVGLPAKAVILKRAYTWLAAQNAARTGYFDYTTAIIV
jgi:hypothetical protein